MNIALDMMGGDYAPEEATKGVQIFLSENNDPSIRLTLIGDEDELSPLLNKYQITSDKFISELTADDLEGGDDEYVVWAGEYRLKQRLQTKLQQLQAIQYGHSALLQ